MSNSFCRSSPSRSASTSASATPIMAMPSSMLLQIFGACPAPARRRARCCGPSRCSSGSAREGRAGAADHEGQGAAWRRRHRRKPARRACRTPPSLRPRHLRAVPTSIVELSISSGPPRGARIRRHQAARTCLPAGSIVITTCAPATAVTATDAVARPPCRVTLRRGRHRVEAAHLVARPVQVGGHRQAHVAQADEMPRLHASPSSFRAMITRMISLVPSRMRCTRRSRM